MGLERPPLGVVRRTRVSFSSLDHGSKCVTNSPHVALERDVNEHLLAALLGMELVISYTRDLVTLNRGQVTSTTPELTPPSPNYHTLSSPTSCDRGCHATLGIGRCGVVSSSPSDIEEPPGSSLKEDFRRGSCFEMTSPTVLLTVTPMQ
ncbi:hypothetical protein TNCV_1785691 [Trichonephila clavipes]|nr:hypothetical protein TNCV_1785691 [Trichonephila clavipes]